jgi:hypothetical protein
MISDITIKLPTAVCLGEAQGYWIGDARLYSLSVPIIHGRRRKQTLMVIVHAIAGDGDTAGETTVLPACENSGLLDTIAPIGGSPRHGCDHRRTLRAAGYEVVGKGRVS